MNRTERTRGVLLRTLDLAPILATAPLTDDDRANDRTAGLAFEPYAMIEHKGSMWVVCQEGVGWEVTDDQPLTIDIYLNQPNTISIMPKWQATLTPAEVRELAGDDVIDLADLVRSFGARLEGNFWAHYRALTD